MLRLVSLYDMICKACTYCRRSDERRCPQIRCESLKLATLTGELQEKSVVKRQSMSNRVTHRHRRCGRCVPEAAHSRPPRLADYCQIVHEQS